MKLIQPALNWVKESPLLLRIYAVVSVVLTLVFATLNLSVHPAAALGTTAFAILFALLLVRGSRVIWVLVTASGVLSLGYAPFTGPPWWSILFYVASLACLLAPSTWRYIWRKRPAKQPWREPRTSSLDPGDHPDHERPKGWYIDPDDPGRMRYWGGEDAGWHDRTTRTPRKTRQALESKAG